MANQRSKPIPLKPAQQRSSAAVGVLLVGLGGAAVFLTDNQAGTTALILLGALFLLMGVVGFVPNSIGKEGIVFDGEQEADVEEALEAADPDVAAPIAEAVAESSPGSSAARGAKNYLSGRQREQNFNEYLLDLNLPDVSVELEPRGLPGGRRPDAILRQRGVVEMEIEFTWVTPGDAFPLRMRSSQRLQQVLGRLALGQRLAERRLCVIDLPSPDENLPPQADEWAKAAGWALLALDLGAPEAEVRRRVHTTVRSLLSGEASTGLLR